MISIKVSAINKMLLRHINTTEIVFILGILGRPKQSNQSN